VQPDRIPADVPRRRRSPRTRSASMNSPPAERLGCALDSKPFGSDARTDAAKLTTLAGVYAAQDNAHGQPGI
jgi:hypothetical protein